MASTSTPGETGSHATEPLPCISLSDVTRRVADRAYHDIRRLANVLSWVNLDSRREDLLDHIRLNRARFIKVYAANNWLAGQHGELVSCARSALAEVQFHRERIDTASALQRAAHVLRNAATSEVLEHMALTVCK